MILFALATGLVGNRMESSVWLRTPSLSACWFIEWFSAASPPTPLSVKP